MKDELIKKYNLTIANEDTIVKQLIKELRDYYKNDINLLDKLVLYYTYYSIYEDKNLAYNVIDVIKKDDDEWLDLYECHIEFTKKNDRPLVFKWYLIQDARGEEFTYL